MRNKTIFAIALLFIWISFFCANVACQENAGKTTIAQNRERLRGVLNKDSVPGASIAVIKHCKTVWKEAFGMANIETNTPATNDTKFGIGSISKSLTMVLALRLQEKGLLSLDEPIEKYLTDYPHKGRGVTIRLIGSHLSGYADAFDDTNYYNAVHYETTADVLKEFYKEPLAAKPGERSTYGTTTFTLVAGAIEKATNRDFPAAMNENVLGPLGLKNIIPNNRRSITANRTAFYVKDDAGKTRKGEFVDSSFKLAGAGFLSTAEDLAKFGAALIDEGFLSKKSLDELFRLAETSSGEKTPFALGFRAVRMPDGKELIHQPGGGIGITSTLFIDRQRKISIAILTNQTDAPIGSLGLLQIISDSFTNKEKNKR